MNDLLGVTVEDLVSVLKKKHARLPFEIGAFVALETCEALTKGPAKVTPSDVRVTDDGSVSVYAPPNSATGAEAAKSVVAILAHVLVAAGSGVPPVLLSLVEHGPSDGRWDLGRLRDELEASLVPLNRQAARRVLSRMLRETRREGRNELAAAEEAPGEVDAELDALIGLDGGDAPPPRSPFDEEARTMERPRAPEPSAFAFAEEDLLTRERPVGPSATPLGAPPLSVSSEPDPLVPLSADLDRQLDRALAGEEADEPVARPRPAEQATVPPPGRSAALADFEEPTERARPGAWERPRARVRTPEPQEVVRPSRRGDVDLSGLEEVAPKKRSGIVWALLFLVLIGALVGGVAYFRPDAIDRLMGGERPEDREAARLAEEHARAQADLNAEHARRFGNLIVEASPPRAQVLLFVGRGPAVAEQLPKGVAHEFIAIADGREPTRAVVPKDAQWEETESGLRYELAMQTGDAEMTFEDLDLGETRLPRDMGAPEPTLGSVRVVTNPPGAKVYQLVGFAPNVRIENLRTDQPQELVVWAPDHRPARVVIGPSDFRDVGGERVAEVQVTLEPRE